MIRYWTDLGVDGWRLDVADELPDEFIEGIRQVLDQYEDRLLIGEVWEDASNKIAYEKRRRYTQGENLNGVMNYPFREAILELLQTNQISSVIYKIQTVLENYPYQFLQQSLNNLGTHDTKRLLTELGNQTEDVRLAYALLFALPGTPCVYYGDEARVSGQADPDNRSFYPWDSIDHHLFYQMKQLIGYRNQHEALQKGETYLFYTENLFRCLRHYENKYTIFMMNLTDQQTQATLENVHWVREHPMPPECYQAFQKHSSPLAKREFVFWNITQEDQKIEVYHGQEQTENKA